MPYGRDSGIQKLVEYENEQIFAVESGILGFGIWNKAQGIGNLTIDIGIQVPLTKNQESTT